MRLLIWVFGSPVALLLVSLGLVVLRGRSNLPAWIARLTAPPFYLVSLPIATLIVGAEMLAVYSFYVISELMSPSGFAWKYKFELFFLNPVPTALLALLLDSFFSVTPSLFDRATIGIFLSFWVVMFVSGYLLWQALLRDNHRQPHSHIGVRVLPGVLLVCFVWALFYLVSYISWLITPLGIFDTH
jgi:hypothetical protein